MLVDDGDGDDGGGGGPPDRRWSRSLMKGRPRPWNGLGMMKIGVVGMESSLEVGSGGGGGRKVKEKMPRRKKT
jgi:hypothetical protein